MNMEGVRDAKRGSRSTGRIETVLRPVWLFNRLKETVILWHLQTEMPTRV